jgi:hypothetical protein
MPPISPFTVGGTGELADTGGVCAAMSDAAVTV